MSDINPMLLIDFYKAVHSDMLPEGMTKSMSYFTPRKSRINQWNKVTHFGLQMFCKTWLIDNFNKNFFNLERDTVVNEYKRVIGISIDESMFDYEKIGKLHDLGYLPVEIISLPEGTMVPMGVPMFGITNTHPEFAWLPQALESLISAEIWYPQVTATVGKTYRTIVNEAYEVSVDDDVPRDRALGAFDFRGDMGLDAALKAGAGWSMSFLNSATIPLVPYLEKMFNTDATKNDVVYGSVSTEHFVMCSNYAVDGDEKTFLRKLLTEIYPDTSFSAVLDSYDYWNVIDNILPQLHDEIMNHNGTMLMRGDSGNPTEVVTKTVFKLWDQFGGTINSKGFKVLDPHVKAIYGDSITVQRAREIYDILIDNGFAANNVSLGVGSFSMHCIEEDGILKPFTRDTFSSAIKACYAEINGKKYSIYKDPKDSNFKKSQKGLCYVFTDEDGELKYQDGYDSDNIPSDNLLKPIFSNSKLLKEYTLEDIRTRLEKESF